MSLRRCEKSSRRRLKVIKMAPPSPLATAGRQALKVSRFYSNFRAEATPM